MKKTEEEMKKLTYDENLTDVQKACLILSKGQNFQKFAVYAQIPRILKENDAQEKFLPLLFEDIQTQDEELQKEAAKGLAVALKNKVKLIGLCFLMKNTFIYIKKISCSIIPMKQNYFI